MRRLGLIPVSLLLVPLAAGSGADVAEAQVAKRAGNACGLRALPLAVGNSWTFVPTAPPNPPSDQAKMFLPTQPKEVVITVADVQAAGAQTTVKLTENIDGKVIESSIVCGAGKFEIAPQSFLYAGEPGGWLGLEFPTWTSTGPSWVIAGGKLAAEWREDVKATWKRLGADRATGKLELERQFTSDVGDEVSSSAGLLPTTRIVLHTTGRVTLDKPVKATTPIELPENWFNAIWLADDVGPVQVLNAYAHQYLLSKHTVAK